MIMGVYRLIEHDIIIKADEPFSIVCQISRPEKKEFKESELKNYRSINISTWGK